MNRSFIQSQLLLVKIENIISYFHLTQYVIPSIFTPLALLTG